MNSSRRTGRLLLLLVAVLAVAGPLGATDFDPIAATEAYLDSVPAEQRAVTESYVEGGYWLLLAALVFDLGFAWWILSGRRSARIRDLAERRASTPARVVALYTTLYWLLRNALALPLVVYQYLLRERAYGFSSQSTLSWSVDFGKRLLLTLLVMGLLHVLLYAGLRRLPRTWWVWGWAVCMLFLAASMVVFPVFVTPVFSEVMPIGEAQVERPILELARENGIPVDRVYVMRDSAKTKRIHAHVGGLFGSQRIVVNDNLLERASLPEIEAVLGHEIAHYKAGHVYRLLFWVGAWLLAGFAFVRWGFERIRRGLGAAWGVRAIEDVAGLPILWGLMSLFLFTTMPFHHGVIRTIETAADRAGLEIARQPDGFAEITLKLGETRKLDPSRWEELIFFAHPSGRSRIRMAMEWKAAHLDEVEDAASVVAPP